jgi:copper chaperone CopZ
VATFPVKAMFRVSGLSCPNCAAKMEQVISRQKGVLEVKVGYATGKITVTFDSNISSETQVFDKVQEAAKSFGFGVEKA